MAKFNRVVATLRKEEQILEAQLQRIRDAIAALGGTVRKEVKQRRRKRKIKKVVRNARTMTAAQRKAVSKRMKKYWAARKKKT